jgi:hypothetical protein
MVLGPESAPQAASQALRRRSPCDRSGLSLCVVAGVAVADRVDVQASRPLRHLHALGLLTLDAPNGTPDAATLDRVLARQALEAYARRRAETAGDTVIIAELAPLVDRAKAAGLDEDTITRCIGQPTVEGRV